MLMISSFLTFPNISWWRQAVKADTVLFDGGEHFQKMSYRNRYRISGANNSILLSVPLADGRNQHTPMNEVRIHNEERWQVQHWRTLVSVYKRSPYFDHYADSLRPLFETSFINLADFNRAGILWVTQQLKLDFKVEETNVYLADYPGDVTDLRNAKNADVRLPKYYQIFEDRIGFVADLSILDMIFSEGPGAGGKLIS